MNPAPTWFKVVAVVALLWNLLGCFAVVADLKLSPEELAKLEPAQRALHDQRPAWAVVASSLAVLGGVVGSLGLLMKKRWAVAAFALSLLGVVVQDFGLFVLARGASLAGPAAAVIQGLVLLIAIGLLALSRKAVTRGWIA